MDDELAAAMERVRLAFARYPRRAVLDGCPHCRGTVRVDEHDLWSLTIGLGGTIGDRDDVKSLLPMLLDRLITSPELDPRVVLSNLPREEWRAWPEAEQKAIESYLDAVWRSLLATYPSQLGSFDRAATFIDDVAYIGESVARYLDIWTVTQGSAADRHMADAVIGLHVAVRKSGPLEAWLRRETIRDRLYRAFERDHGSIWADELAEAYDLLSA